MDTKKPNEREGYAKAGIYDARKGKPQASEIILSSLSLSSSSLLDNCS